MSQLKRINSKAEIGIKRFFTREGTNVHDQFSWVKRDAKIDNPMTGEIVFEQKGVEFPDSWSGNAINIVTQKYFYGTPGEAGRENSLEQLVGRVVGAIVKHGEKENYFTDRQEQEVFEAELTYILTSQRAAFNSPVWFNIGTPDRRQQASACFILQVEDTMEAILNWYTEEGKIFKGGSGAGVNLSNLRSSQEKLSSSGGMSSGPVSFMRGADSVAGTIKSGGKTRRAAKMVMLDIDHPDIEEFIWCKAIEERKSRALKAAGFDMSLNGKDAFSVQYQNANNSVRVSDEFMKAVDKDQMWSLRAVKDSRVIKKLPARDLMRQIAESAWECADPGVQYDGTINAWHTTPNKGPITGSNPCSEYMSIDNSACNLASINLLQYLNDNGTIDVEAFTHTVDVLFLAQEILCGYSVYPTDKIAENTYAYRQIGLGFANLGALLMAQGLGYDSQEGRAQAAAITALMGGQAYATSAKIAKRVGTFDGFALDSENTINVLKKHRDQVSDINVAYVQEDLMSAATNAWDTAVEQAQLHGVRNAQATVLAPTGTISFMMDCDTTGIEPDFALVKMKKLVGGGTMKIVNNSVKRALNTLGYSSIEQNDIINYLNEEMTIVGAPHLKQEHVKVFAVAVGDNSIHYNGHIKMMGACQPFLSGAISKTVNMPEEVTVEDVEQVYIDSWKLGLKAVAIYRDNCKVAQPLGSAKKEDSEEDKEVESVSQPLQSITPKTQYTRESFVVNQPVRRKMPRVRQSKTYRFKIADFGGYFTVGEFDDGKPGELFINVAKQGSTMSGIMDAFARSVSFGLQHGVPLKSYVDGLTSMTFAPYGKTNDEEISNATSIMDYIFKRIGKDYLTLEEQLETNLVTFEDFELEQATIEEAPTVEAVEQPAASTGQATSQPAATEVAPGKPAVKHQESSAPLCTACGNQTQRSGACYVCSACGATTGCG